MQFITFPVKKQKTKTKNKKFNITNIRNHLLFFWLLFCAALTARLKMCHFSLVCTGLRSQFLTVKVKNQVFLSFLIKTNITEKLPQKGKNLTHNPTTSTQSFFIVFILSWFYSIGSHIVSWRCNHLYFSFLTWYYIGYFSKLNYHSW